MGKNEPQRKDSSSAGANFFRSTWRLSGPDFSGIRDISDFVRRDSKAEKVSGRPHSAHQIIYKRISDLQNKYVGDGEKTQRSGTISGTAEKASGKWKYLMLDVILENGRRIDFMSTSKQ